MASSEQQYQKLSEIDHILLRPGRAIGSIETHEENIWVLDPDSETYKKEKISYNPAFLKLFDEIITNSVDESKREHSTLDTIKVTIPENSSNPIVVEDNGGIPVQVHSEEKQWIPEMIFSELRAGSNFDDSQQRTGGGAHGEGSVLSNIFSHSFLIETSDGNQKFRQQFQDNMKTRGDPKVTSNSTKGTRISYHPDYDKLGCSLNENNRKMLIKRVYDIAGTNPNLKISLNGKRIKINKFRDYVSLYTDDFCYEEQNRWQVAVAPSTDGQDTIAFVNSIETPQGTHVDHVLDKIVEELRAYIKKKKKYDIKPNEIKKNITLFLNSEIFNPQFSSQTKEKLITQPSNFPENFEPSKRFINKIISSSVLENIFSWIDAKQQAEENKKKKNKEKETKNKKIPKYIHANAKDRENCTLFLAEGDSAASNFIPVRDKNYHGLFPLGGKPLNVMGRKQHEILENKELSSIMNILGLSFDSEPKDLNYGYVVLLTDEDFDGNHIQALLINFFNQYWPKMIEEGRILLYHSPILTAKKGKQKKNYYSMEEYKKDAPNLEGWEISYKKGLGALSQDEYHEMINNQQFLEVLTLDNESARMLEMAFGSDAEKRKQWLQG